MDTLYTKVVVYLARHGECGGNVSDDFLDPFTDALTEVGKAQAERLGSHLQNILFSRIFSSDFLRAEQTARIILSQLKDSTTEANLVTDKRLREKDHTGVVGEPTAVEWVLMATSMEGGTSNPEVSTCEAVEDFEARLISFISQLLHENINGSSDVRFTNENILVVSHGLAIQKLMCLLNSCPSKFGIDKWTGDERSEKLMKNASYHKICFEISSTSQHNKNGDKVEIIKISGQVESAHCRDHLDSNLGSIVEEVSN